MIFKEYYFLNATLFVAKHLTLNLSDIHLKINKLHKLKKKMLKANKMMSVFVIIMNLPKRCLPQKTNHKF